MKRILLILVKWVYGRDAFIAKTKYRYFLQFATPSHLNAISYTNEPVAVNGDGNIEFEWPKDAYKVKLFRCNAPEDLSGIKYAEITAGGVARYSEFLVFYNSMFVNDDGSFIDAFIKEYDDCNCVIRRHIVFDRDFKDRSCEILTNENGYSKIPVTF